MKDITFSKIFKILFCIFIFMGFLCVRHVYIADADASDVVLSEEITYDLITGEYTYTYTLENINAVPIYWWGISYKNDPAAIFSDDDLNNADVGCSEGWINQALPQFGGFYDLFGDGTGYYSTYASDFESENEPNLGYYQGPGETNWYSYSHNNASDEDLLDALDNNLINQNSLRGGYWGWNGTGADIFTEYGIGITETGTYQILSAELFDEDKTFFYNTTDYWDSYYNLDTNSNVTDSVEISDTVECTYEGSATLQGSLDYLDNEADYLPCGCDGNLNPPVRVDIYSKVDGAHVASTLEINDVLLIDTNCTTGQYFIEALPKGPYTLVATDLNPLINKPCYENSTYRGVFETLAIDLQLEGELNWLDILMSRSQQTYYQIQGTVTKNPPGPGKIELILHGTTTTAESVREKAVLNESGNYSFSMLNGNYTILAQAVGYTGSTDDAIVVADNNEVRNFTLNRKSDPSASIIREDMGTDEDFNLGLYVRYNSPSGEPQEWTDAGAELTITLFSPADDSDDDGVPDDLNNPTGIEVTDSEADEGVFEIGYRTAQIVLGNLAGTPGNIMTELSDPDRYIVGLRAEIEINSNTYAFVRTFTVLKPAANQSELLYETKESFVLTEASTKTDIPIAVNVPVGDTEVVVTTGFNAANLDPTLLSVVDEDGNKDASVDLNQELELTIEYKTMPDDPDKIVVNIAFKDQNGNPVEYNPPDPVSGERNPDASLIIIDVPLHRDLQNLILDPDVSLSDIEDLVAKNSPDDFVENSSGEYEPDSGLYGIYFESGSGVIEVFRPDAQLGEGIEVLVSGGALLGRVTVGHTSEWFSSPPEEMDGDGDGFTEVEGDCDDTDPTRYPDAPGTHQNKDNNCNGVINNNEKKPSSGGTGGTSHWLPTYPIWSQGYLTSFGDYMPQQWYQPFQQQQWYQPFQQQQWYQPFQQQQWYQPFQQQQWHQPFQQQQWYQPFQQQQWYQPQSWNFQQQWYQPQSWNFQQQWNQPQSWNFQQQWNQPQGGYQLQW